MIKIINWKRERSHLRNWSNCCLSNSFSATCHENDLLWYIYFVFVIVDNFIWCWVPIPIWCAHCCWLLMFDSDFRFRAQFWNETPSCGVWITPRMGKLSSDYLLNKESYTEKSDLHAKSAAWSLLVLIIIQQVRENRIQKCLLNDLQWIQSGINFLCLVSSDSHAF